jgi:hypothetical protein
VSRPRHFFNNNWHLSFHAAGNTISPADHSWIALNPFLRANLLPCSCPGYPRPLLQTAKIVSKVIQAGKVKPLKLPARSPNLNAFAERWVRSVKEECLSRLIFFGEHSLRRALMEYIDHFHGERNHQGKGNKLLFPVPGGPGSTLSQRNSAM